MFPNIDDYTYKFDQLSQIDWRITVISKDNVKMSLDIRSGTQPPPIPFVFSIIQDKEKRKNFIIELEEIKPAPEVKVEEIKLPPESIKVEGLTEEAKIEVVPQENKV